MMARIIEQAEASRFYAPPPSEPGRSTREAIAHAACNIAREVGARVLVAFTESGMSPRLISKARPGVPIIAFASDEANLRPLALYWGVMPRLLAFPEMPDVDALVAQAGRDAAGTEAGGARRSIRDGVRGAGRLALADQRDPRSSRLDVPQLRRLDCVRRNGAISASKRSPSAVTIW